MSIASDFLAVLAFGAWMGLLLSLVWPMRKRKPTPRPTVPAPRWPKEWPDA